MRILIVILFLFINSKLFSQNIYIDNNSYSKETVKVYITKVKTEAKLIVYESDRRVFNSGNFITTNQAGLWYFCKNKSEANYIIRIVKNKAEADLIIYLTKNKSEIDLNKNRKK